MYEGMPFLGILLLHQESLLSSSFCRRCGILLILHLNMALSSVQQMVSYTASACFVEKIIHKALCVVAILSISLVLLSHLNQSLCWIYLSSGWDHECTVHYRQQRPPSLIVGSITLCRKNEKCRCWYAAAVCIWCSARRMHRQSAQRDMPLSIPFMMLATQPPKNIGKGATRHCYCRCLLVDWCIH